MAHGNGSGNGAGDRHPDIDWAAAEQLPEFRELVARKRRFVVPATIFFLSWFFGFILLCGYAPDFMGETVIWDGFTVGYLLALSQFVMTWGLTALYLRVADRVFDPLARRASDRALELARPAAATAGARRFERTPQAETAEEVTRR